MTDELYINGIKADLGTSDISLKYNSNLLTDISRIVSNTSYTIRLPKTQNNIRLIECSHVPSAITSFPYMLHAATLVRDGIEIVSKASVILLSVTDYIEIALMWGNVTNFAPIMDKSLRDLNYTLEDYVTWHKGANSRRFPRVDYGFTEGDAEVWYHPAVSVRWVLDKIGNIELPSDRQKELDEMFIPILDSNDSELLSNRESGNLAPYRIVQSDYFRLIEFQDFLNPKRNDYFYYSIVNKHTIKAKDHKMKISLDGYITFEAEVNGSNGDPNTASIPVKFQVRNKNTNGSPVLAEVTAEVTHIAGQKWKYYFSFADCSFDLEPNAEVSFVLIDIYTVGDVYNISVLSGDAGSIWVKGIYDSISLGDRYYIVPNLPDLKQIDFLKAISGMLGLFAVPSEGKIKFISFDTLDKNKAVAVDWSNYILYEDEMLPNIEYALDMARYNKFKYKEREDGTQNEGVIRIDNKTLEYERDVIELPFTTSKMKNGLASIPLYSYDGNILKIEKVENRILRYQGTDGIFDMFWDTLLEKYYANYSRMVNQAKVITEKVRLDSVLLKNIDLSIPVYIRQYGSYFAIISIVTKNDNISEVKLLKM